MKNLFIYLFIGGDNKPMPAHYTSPMGTISPTEYQGRIPSGQIIAMDPHEGKPWLSANSTA